MSQLISQVGWHCFVITFKYVPEVQDTQLVVVTEQVAQLASQFESQRFVN